MGRQAGHVQFEEVRADVVDVGVVLGVDVDRLAPVVAAGEDVDAGQFRAGGEAARAREQVDGAETSLKLFGRRDHCCGVPERGGFALQTTETLRRSGDT